MADLKINIIESNVDESINKSIINNDKFDNLQINVNEKKHMESLNFDTKVERHKKRVKSGKKNLSLKIFFRYFEPN